MTARSSGNTRRALVAHEAGEAFDITTHVKASRRAQGLPETVNDPAVLERFIALLRVAGLDGTTRSRRRDHGQDLHPRNR